MSVTHPGSMRTLRRLSTGRGEIVTLQVAARLGFGLWFSEPLEAYSGSVVKNPPANARDLRDAGLIPGSRRSSGGGHRNPLQYSFLENLMDEEPGRL